MLCHAAVCLHCDHRQGLTRDCCGSSVLWTWPIKSLRVGLRTTCSRFLSSFPLLEHTTPSTQHTHTHRAHATHTHTNTLTASQHTIHTDTHQNTHRTDRHTHNTQFTVFRRFRVMPLLKNTLEITIGVGVVVENGLPPDMRRWNGSVHRRGSHFRKNETLAVRERLIGRNMHIGHRRDSTGHHVTVKLGQQRLPSP